MIVAQGTAAGAHALRTMPCVYRQFRWQRRVSAPCRPARRYLSRQLRDFSSGARANAVMSPIAQALSADDVDDVAAYFASVETPFPALPSMPMNLVKKGEELAESGIPAKGIPGCGSCHGAGGVGEPPTIPYLAGQYARYTRLNCRCGSAASAGITPRRWAVFQEAR